MPARTGESLGRRKERRSWRRSAPVAFLVTSLIVAGFSAFEAYRAARSHRTAATGVLTDYGEFAAWSFEQRATELLTMRFESTFRIVHSNAAFQRGEATEQCLLLLLGPESDGCSCGPDLAGAWSFLLRLGSDPAEAEWGGEPPGPSVRADALRRVATHAREVYREGWRFAVASAPDGGPIVAYARLIGETRLDDALSPVADTLIYGVEADQEAVRDLYRAALDDASLLPGSLTRGHPNDEVVQVDVVGPAGQVAYASHPGAVHAYPAEIDVREILGGGVIRASVVPEMADQLVIGGLPRDRTPLLLLVLVLASTLAAAALVQLRREDRLALLRQDFVASVSHELRTPLAQVRLFTETLRLGRIRNDGERDWALENIDRETLRLVHLVENILHFSRAERGVRNAEREPLDLCSETREAVRAFAPLVPPTRTRFRVDAPGEMVAEVHRDSYRQVLLNYLDNAVRYGGSGQTVTVHLERSDRNAIRVHVDDEGSGVPPSEREAIFEPFRRGEARMGTVVPGSGIGLSVVREIADAHRGRAWVEDAPGGGARFVLEVPALDTASEAHFRESDGSGRTTVTEVA